MAYSFQTFVTSQILTSTQMNQVEANIKDHVHGNDGVTNTSFFTSVSSFFFIGSCTAGYFLNTTNTRFGYGAFLVNTLCYFNTIFGGASLPNNTTGSYNTGIGYSALSSNTTGSDNTGIGYSALSSNTTGIDNTGIGRSAGSNITTGTNITCLGYNAQPIGPGSTNQIVLGNSAITDLYCYDTTIASPSDRRDKTDIASLDIGLDFINAIIPRSFRWDRREWYDDGKADGSKKESKLTAGFIAQELDDACKVFDAYFLNLVIKEDDEKWIAKYGKLLPVMVRAIQELSQKIEMLENAKP